MIILMKKNSTKEDINEVTAWIESAGYRPHISEGVERTIIGAVGNDQGRVLLKSVAFLRGVEKVVPILKPYKLAGREFQEKDTIVRVGNVEIGGPQFTVIAGPCSIESAEQMMESGYIAKKAGAHVLRGGAFKPRTSPYSFQGMGEEGLKILKNVGEKMGMPVVTEVMDTKDIDLIEDYSDMFQIGARNVQNFALLKRVGMSRKPVLLKRGMMTTIEELLMSAEYILSGGNNQVILCERGIRTFETATRNTLDISAVPVIKELTHLPVIIDPSHAAGHAKYIIPLTRAAVAVGAHGAIIEIHPEPEKALSDGPQSLRPEVFYRLMDEVRIMQDAMQNKIGKLS
ncbi:MAG: 3-deoxy-7-phosphoheptulonate synthase [Syntrophales bacterium]|nr:3-deoxy-7-phosphoheptulonate synthase [Syntrophales bacterium]